MAAESNASIKPKALAFALAAVLCGCVLAVGCAPTPSSSGDAERGDASGEADAVAFAWSEDSDCTVCHAQQSSSFDDGACLAAVHAVSKENCMLCHSDGEGLVKAHKNVTMEDTDGATKLKRTEIGNDSCLSCHAQDELAVATEGVTVCTDENGRTENPHDLPIAEDHERIACADCHAMHAESDPLEAAPQECLNCHHEGVYECGTCHA